MSLNAPIIETKRLTLRAPKIDDHAALCAYYQDPRSRFNGGPRDAREVAKWLAVIAGLWALRGYGIWHITQSGRDDCIGFAGIYHPIHYWPEAELGYAVFADFEGKGIAFEAACAAREAAHAHFGLTNLPSYINPENARSIALAKRMGAVFESEMTLVDSPVHVYRHSMQEAA